MFEAFLVFLALGWSKRLLAGQFAMLVALAPLWVP